MDFIDTLRGAPNTRRTYLSLYNNHLDLQFRKLGAVMFQHDSMFKLCHEWDSDGLHPRTIKMLLNLSKKMAKYYKAEEMFDMKELVRGFCQVQQGVPKAMSTEKAQDLLRKAKAEGQEFYVVVLLGLHAGMRVTEAITIKADDIKGEWLLIGNNSSTKNKMGRKIRMSDTLQKEIAKLDMKSTKLIHLTPSTINRKLRALADISFHSCRHSFATMALESGISPKLVQQALGHKSLTTTLDTYWNSTQSGMSDFSFLPEVK